MGATTMLLGASKGQRLLSGLLGIESLVSDAQGETWMSAGMRDQLKLLASA